MQSLIEYGNVVFLDSRTYKKLSLDNMQLWASLTPLHIAAIAGSVEVAQVCFKLVCGLSGGPIDPMIGVRQTIYKNLFLASQRKFWHFRY